MKRRKNILLSAAYLIILLSGLLPPAVRAAAPETLVAEVPFLAAAGTTAADQKYGRIFNIEIAAGAPAIKQLAVISAPPIIQPRYAITGFIRYENVPAPGYLEIWNHFPGGGAYFSRTLGGDVMAPISGTSGWRRFVLPFYTDGAAAKMVPEQIELNLVLPQGGKASFAGVELHQFGPGVDPINSFSGGWWSPAQLGGLSNWFTVILVIWWASISVLAARGKARSFVLGSLKIGAVLGAAALLLLLAAAAKSQPFHVLLPLGIVGAILIAPAVVQTRKLCARYDEIDQRKMLARDARL